MKGYCTIIGALTLIGGCAPAHQREGAPTPIQIVEPEVVQTTVVMTELPSGQAELLVINESDLPLEVLIEGGKARGIVEPGESQLFSEIPAGVWVAFQARDVKQRKMARVPIQKLEPGTRFKWRITKEDVVQPIP